MAVFRAVAPSYATTTKAKSEARVTRSGRRRGYWLIAVIGLATLAVACGRASEDEINAALGITPTATLSAEQQATSTAVAIENATRAAEGGVDQAALDTTDLAALGNLMLGRTYFAVQCQRCHTPGGVGSAPALAGPDNPATSLTDRQIFNVIRDGTGHGADVGGPGPSGNQVLTDRQIYDLIAFIRSQ